MPHWILLPQNKKSSPPATSPKLSLSSGSSLDLLYSATPYRSQSLTSGSKVAGHEALLPSPRLLFCRGVRVAGESDRGRGRRRRPLIGPGATVRVHGVRADGLDLEGRDGLGDRRDAAGLGRHGRTDRRPGAVGRDDGRRPRLLRARQPRHLQRPRALHGARAVLGERHLRRRRRAPRLVLQLRRDHGHGAPHGLRAAALHRRAVARHRRLTLPPLRRRRQLRRQAGTCQGPRGQGRRSVRSLCTRRGIA